MLHSEARELLVQGYEAAHDAKGIAKAYSVSKWTVYRPAEQKRKAGSVALRTSQRGRKPVLAAEDKENIQHCMDEIPDVTIEEIREKLNLPASYSIVDRAIAAAMGYTVKKKSLCASERVRCAGKEQRMESDHKT
ncbi:MAG: transcriptional regulator [Oscillospiraceae bacterium]|nr:transcriptional regulator [Oscillospiraceae bacterium]